MKAFYRLLGLALTLTLVACGGVKHRDGPGQVAKTTKTQPVVPKQEPLSKYGNPESYVVFGKRYYPIKTNVGFREQGIASWYGKKFHGRKTSSGEIYDMYKMTAAHKHLPLPSFVNVRSLETGNSIVVRVNDRGPFHDGRVIDLSYAAASKLGMLEKGTARVEVTAINSGETRRSAKSANQNNGNADKSEIIIDLTKQLEKEQIPYTVIPEQTAASNALDSIDQTPETPQEVYLQIGSFRERGNAQIALDKVIPHIPGARIQEARNGDVPVYRVQVGPIVDGQNADIFVERLLTLGFAEHHFISP